MRIKKCLVKCNWTMRIIYWSCKMRLLHSFPTRRSSDLGNAIKFTDDGEVVVTVGLQIADCGLQIETREQSSANLQSAICNLQFAVRDRKSTRLNSSHTVISYAVYCLKNKKDAK